jgi:site-specific recombinase XerD
VSGPLERYATGFSEELRRVGYTPNSAALQLQLMAHLGRWLEERSLSLERLSSSEAARFVAARRAGGYANHTSLKGLEPLLGYLRGFGAVPPAERPALSAVELLLVRYRDYLLAERGLMAGTARGYVDLVRPFVASRLDRSGELELASVTPSDVLGFVVAECRRCPRRQAKLMVTALRSLLGFLHYEGLVARPLAQVVPSVAFWRLQGLPRGLDAESVGRLLSSCDRETIAGRRDLAMLLMLVRLGMRRGELARLGLGDIDWRAGEVLVRGKGNRLERLPLPVDVGEALADYLRHGRPADAEGRSVFVRVKAPHRAITASGITQAVVSASRRAGVPSVTAHRLRHTAASELLRQGAPLREIGQLLRHRSELSTAIYAKVDRHRLRELARPWPLVAQRAPDAQVVSERGAPAGRGRAFQRAVVKKTMPKLRFQPPDRLRGAADYSEHPGLRGSLNAVKLVKSQRWAWDGLRAACELEVKYARKREPGHWELVAVAFVASRHVDVQPWYDETTDEIWRECGFARRPSRQTAHRRLRELNGVCDEFLTAAGAVIRRCRGHDSRVMAHVHFDFTEDETHAALVHDCQAGEPCKRAKSGSRQSAPAPALRPRRAATQEARERRERWNEEDPDDSVNSAKAVTPKTMEVWRDGLRIKRVQVNGCWYRTRDAEAGVRAYTSKGKTKRFWHGYYSGKAVDHYTGGVIPSVDPANKQEYDLFIPLYDRVVGMVGEAPQTVMGDRGLSVERCFEHATTNGSAPVFPWRKHKNQPQRRDKLTHDRHGVMRCKHCGGPMSQVKYSKNKGKPRLWFRCSLGTTPDCARDQTITCATDWRSLVPLARTEPLYHELRKSHRSYEAAHDYWRDRYRVAADTLANRPKGVGLDWHRLRANVACLVDWLRIAAVNGWLGSTRRAARSGRDVRPFRWGGREAARVLGDARKKAGLGDPYGPRAKALRAGEELPPSERARGAPPGP